MSEQTTPMTAYLGFLRTTEVEVTPDDVGCGAGRVPCFECKGTGWWAYAEPQVPGGPCVVCKGASTVLVSI